MTDSGDSFFVDYCFSAGSQSEAEDKASGIAVEQSAELPVETVPRHLLDYVGTVEELQEQEEAGNRWKAKIFFKKEIVSGDTVQFLNVVFGNVSIKPGVQVTGLDPGFLSTLFSGPNHGIDGIRERLSAPKRPLSCTALKPIGSSSEELARIATEFAGGGIDIIKDDHGLANQSLADFKSRVQSCVPAIRDAENLSGKKTLYFPNITGTFRELTERAEFAAQHGADGFLISPQLTGLYSVSELAAMFPDMPIMAHPAFSGPYTIHKHSGFAPSVYFGMLWRALGADCVIYPNAGGRFSYHVDECNEINRMCRSNDLQMKRSFPVPAGGIDRNSLQKWMDEYGADTLFLIGGSLYKHPKGLTVAAREFQTKLSEYE
ncbi:hypothetical protein DYD21_12540 [Rhodohalobacter sp. SW132]|uniref:RuBisCO large subunit C-terminal-like domain-containing protein n=1 Tax=Rhodohalobacter sp. SW132 TaxID=2293433 RepID=UPI000E23BF3A|nr:RuBisCO large subunit C-terminal-like domain-containing protein [Rhodohalobacter sp. SW132]REL33080.1 hypothetical protein DYD21_12540 [Rhodohalobacter sp. SW132]